MTHPNIQGPRHHYSTANWKHPARKERSSSVAAWAVVIACMVLVTLVATVVFADLPVPIHPDCMGYPKC